MDIFLWSTERPEARIQDERGRTDTLHTEEGTIDYSLTIRLSSSSVSLLSTRKPDTQARLLIPIKWLAKIANKLQVTQQLDLWVKCQENKGAFIFLGGRGARGNEGWVTEFLST